MPKDRFAASDVTRYPLADGEDWVEFRNALTWGEDRRLAADTAIIGTETETDDDGKESQTLTARIDWGIYNVHHIATYLSAWSFKGPDEKTAVPISVQTVAALSPAVGDELVTLLDRHISEQKLKNAPTGASE